MPRGAYWRQGDGEVWVDVWTHMPVELRQKVVALALQRGATVLEVVEALLWLGLLRHEEVRRRRAPRPSSPNSHYEAGPDSRC